MTGGEGRPASTGTCAVEYMLCVVSLVAPVEVPLVCHTLGHVLLLVTLMYWSCASAWQQRTYSRFPLPVVF